MQSAKLCAMSTSMLRNADLFAARDLAAQANFS
jgi:hypothetical protein